MMKTELITENWQPEPPRNLVKSFSIEYGKNLYNDRIEQHAQSFTWEDIRGLSWIFINDDEI